MPLGSFRLNSISAVAAAPAGARASAATYTVQSGTPAFQTFIFKYGTASRTYAGGQYSDIDVNPTDTNFYFTYDKNWTIEWWMFSTTNTFSTVAAYIVRPGSTAANFSIQTNTGVSGGLKLTIASTDVVTWTQASATWQHFALVNTYTSGGSSTLRLYRDGTQLGSNITFSNTTATRTTRIGTQNTLSPATSFRFDDVRISNIARYSSSFTAPTAAFTNDANTLALFHFDSTLTDDTA
jgi:lipid-binding SYLF domain-containing protein